MFTNLKCLKMEVRFMSVWKDRPIHNVKELSEKIQERVSRLIILGREFSEPAAASLVVCAPQLQNQSLAF